MSEEMELQGTVGAAPGWLGGLIRAVRGEAMPPKDPRVKSLWGLLRQRGLLARSPWLRQMLRRIWSGGLAARPRPRITRRLVRLLRRWGILPGRTAWQTAPQPVPGSMRYLQPVGIRRARPLRLRRWGTARPLRLRRWGAARPAAVRGRWAARPLRTRRWPARHVGPRR
jgi:hypothetical protein